MRRTTFHALAVLLAVIVAVPAFAQAPDLEAARTAMLKVRQSTIAQYMELTEAEGRAFWPVYREYRMEMSRFGDRLIDLIAEYGAKYETLSDADSLRMLDEYFSIQAAEQSLRKKYVKRFQKVLPGKKVGRFYQIENKLDAAVRYELSELVPLAK